MYWTLIKISQEARAVRRLLDNAVAESFLKSLKTELVYGSKLISREQMELEIFEYIEICYNKKRRYSALNYKSE